MVLSLPEGTCLAQAGVVEALVLCDRGRYIVSRHAASGLDGEDGVASTYTVGLATSGSHRC